MVTIWLITVIVSLLLTWTILRHLHYAEFFRKYDKNTGEFIERINVFQRVKFSLIQILGLLILSFIPVFNLGYIFIAIAEIHSMKPKSYSSKGKVIYKGSVLKFLKFLKKIFIDIKI